MYFVYDASGPFAINANGTTYYYVKNAQGDITAIVNKAGTAVVTYSYDAWGNLLSIDGEYKNGLGLRNPLRYRGYVYDTETGLYYVSSRYYDPATSRFLNADILISTGQGILGNNMFAYCRNNPVCRFDVAGTDDENCLSDKQDEDLVPDIAGGGTTPPQDSGIPVGTVGNTGNGVQISISQSGIAATPNPNNEKTEVHHIVEQCQVKKSGFEEVDIQGNRNLISIPYNLHRKITGYYGSIKPFTDGLRVRNWLAGQSFEDQYKFGIDILEKLWGEFYGP